MTNVLMYSGGMDSFIISRTMPIDVYVFVVLGNEDNARELDRFQADTYLAEEKCYVVNMPALAEYELDNKILPYRNHMLAMIGAQYGNNIYFGFTGGDTTKDKDFVFKSQIEGMLNYFALDQHKVNHIEYPYTVEMPFKEHSKGQMVHEYSAKATSLMSDLWTVSRSCYAGTDKECGLCRSCQRKYVALAVNGYLDIWKKFENDPRPGLVEFLKESETKGRFQTEMDEIKAAIEGKVLYK